jgi:molybdopterin adenylyltransferase
MFNYSLIITTGGTGPAASDLTPDETTEVCSRILPGFGELMRMKSLKFVATAILSRQASGIRGSSLQITLRGN